MKALLTQLLKPRQILGVAKNNYLYIVGCLQPVNTSDKRNIQLCSGYNYDNYEQERKNCKLDVPEYFNFTGDFIDNWANAEQVPVLFPPS